MEIRAVWAIMVAACMWVEHATCIPCQVRASDSCLCKPFSAVHPEWGIDKACCMSPQNYAGNSSTYEENWCYCEEEEEEEGEILARRQNCAPDPHPFIDEAGGKWMLGESASGALSLECNGKVTWSVLPSGDIWSRATDQLLEFADMHVQPEPAGHLEQMTAREVGQWRLGEATSGVLAFDFGLKSVLRVSSEGVWCASSGKFLGSDTSEVAKCGSLVPGRFASFGDWRMGETSLGDFGIFSRAASHLDFRCLFKVTPEGKAWDRAAGGWVGSRQSPAVQDAGTLRHSLFMTENGRGGGLNVAHGCQYKVKPEPSGVYPDKTGLMLTNGNENDNWCSKCNTWCSVGWQNSSPEVDLELVPPGGGTVAIKRLKIHFSESQACGIKWPNKIKALITRDGMAWEEVGNWPSPQMRADEAMVLDKYEDTGQMVDFPAKGGWITIELAGGMSAKTIRLKITRGGSWTVISEVRVET